MGILEGKTILVTGVTMHTSIAYKVTEIAQHEGARVIVSNIPRAIRVTQRAVRRLDEVPEVIELDATDDEQLAALPETLRELGIDRLDGVVHAIAYANPKTALGGGFLNTPWSDVDVALHTSTYSYVSLAKAVQPLFGETASVVGLTFDATVAWPFYDWMGVAKAGLESANRYLARYLGKDKVRCNLVSAGPLDTMAKTAIPGADAFNDLWSQRAPLGWDTKDATAAARAVVALLSDWFPATTGEMVHADGGLHSTGA
ncbi:enoyl-ACP reductase FabI [Acidipropionibacterium jensenii]|uniref:enoyl-ACP reductase FabI n=1 Tax=Acidipropionibacterium jensenii TaxID=1749 RepID=UPI00214AF125|nr:enoyl-ACP reductase FabI [Acidipropionibacterium jensenii]